LKFSEEFKGDMNFSNNQISPPEINTLMSHYILKNKQAYCKNMFLQMIAEAKYRLHSKRNRLES